MTNTYNKENYLQADPTDINSEWWNTNITGVLINYYKPWMKGKVAEFGCNHGVQVATVSLFNNIDEVVGFDINSEAISIAKSDVIMNQIESTKNKVKFIETNLTSIDWESDYFDFAYSIHTLEHIYPEDVDKVMSEMSRLLKSGAYFLINLPDKNSYSWESLHVYKPDINELCNLFEKHGFEKLECYLDDRGGQVGPSINITGMFRKK